MNIEHQQTATHERITNVQTPVIAVVGLGYVGLPLAAQFGKSGLRTIGYEINERRVSELSSGSDSINELSNEELTETNIEYTSAASCLREASVIIVTVPTPITRTNQPDLSLVKAATKTVGQHLSRGAVVAYESTVYPGVTEDICVPILEQASGMKWKEDFFVGYSPERVNPGDKEHTIDKIVKVVSGDTPETLQTLADVYSRICKAGVHKAPNIKTAEAAKVIENTQRDLNIALANELSLIFHRIGINTMDVLKAAGTKWNFHTYHPGLVGGHCLSGSHRITVLNGNHHKARSLTAYCEELKRKNRIRTEELGDATLLHPKEPIRVLSFNYTAGNAVFAPLTCFSIRPAGPGFSITTAGNHTIEVSARHPMIVDENGTWFVKHAEDVAVGDRIPLAQTFPQRDDLRTEIDLIKEMPNEWHKRYRVKRKQGSWREIKDTLNVKRNTGKKASNYYYFDYLPLSVYLELERKGCMPISRNDVLLVSGRGKGSFQKVPAVLPIDAPFARLMGYFLSEGCISHDNTTRVRFAFYRQEKDTIADCVSLIRHLGIHRHCRYEDKGCQTTHIKVSSELIGYLFEHVLRTGVRSEDAKVPEEFLYANDEIRWNLLTGLFRGDGGVDWQYSPSKQYRKNGKVYSHKRNFGNVSFFSSSPELFQNAQLLLMSFSIPFTRDRKRPLLEIQGTENLLRFRTFFLDDKKKKIDGYFSHKTRSPRSKIFVQQNGYVTVPVKTIRPIRLNRSYSYEVEGTHTMITDGGIITHNCIGVDPYYLVSKAEELGYHPDVIAAGRRINDSMAEFVADETVKALIQIGKQVQGASVLVLGLTFKENIPDFRNSKIRDTIAKLQTFGVRITAHDPFLGEETIRNEFGISSVTELSGTYDAVIVSTPHDRFGNLEERIPSLLTRPGAVIDVKSRCRGLADNPDIAYWSL